MTGRWYEQNSYLGKCLDVLEMSEDELTEELLEDIQNSWDELSTKDKTASTKMLEIILEGRLRLEAGYYNKCTPTCDYYKKCQKGYDPHQMLISCSFGFTDEEIIEFKRRRFITEHGRMVTRMQFKWEKELKTKVQRATLNPRFKEFAMIPEREYKPKEKVNKYDIIVAILGVLVSLSYLAFGICKFMRLL